MSYPNPNTTPDDIEIVRATCRDCGTDIYAAPICDHPGEVCETCEGIAHSAKLAAETDDSTNPLDDARTLFAEITVREWGQQDNVQTIGPYSPYDPDASDKDACCWLEDALRRQGDDVIRVWVGADDVEGPYISTRCH